MSVTTQSATRRLAPHVRRIVGDSLFRNSFGQMASTVLTGLLGYCFWIAAALSAVRPRAAILIALIVGTPIPIVEAMRTSGLPGGIAALGFSFAGALVGAYLGILVKRAPRPT